MFRTTGFIQAIPERTWVAYHIFANRVLHTAASFPFAVLSIRFPSKLVPGDGHPMLEDNASATQIPSYDLSRGRALFRRAKVNASQL